MSQSSGQLTCGAQNPKVFAAAGEQRRDRVVGVAVREATDRMPGLEVCDIVQEAVIKTTPKKKKCKKAKWLSEEALQIAEKRREAKSKGEKERYTHLNEEFQRIAKRDKKALQLSSLRGLVTLKTAPRVIGM